MYQLHVWVCMPPKPKKLGIPLKFIMQKQGQGLILILLLQIIIVRAPSDIR